MPGDEIPSYTKVVEIITVYNTKVHFLELRNELKYLNRFEAYFLCKLRETQNHLFLFIVIRGKFLSSGRDPFDKEAVKDQ